MGWGAFSLVHGRHTRAGQPVDRRNIDDGAPARPKHGLNFVLHAVEDAENIDRHRVAGVFERYFVSGGGFRVVRCTVDRAIQLTKTIYGKGDESGDGRRIAHITFVEAGIAKRAELQFRRRTPFRVSRGHHHLGAARNKRLCGSKANARGSTNDQCNSTVKTMHAAACKFQSTAKVRLSIIITGL